MKACMRRYMNPFGAAILTALLLATGISPLPVGAQETERPVISAEIMIEGRPGRPGEGQAGRRRVPAEGRQAGRREHRRPGLPARHDRAGAAELAGCDRPVPGDAGAQSRSAPGAPRPGTSPISRRGEDGNAAYHFRLALGTKDLPAIVRARALAFLDRIRRRKTWSVTGSVAVLPDSNINAATSARLVELLGLPARLSEDARQTSGVGLSANISGGYEGRISPDLRFRVGGGLRTRTYRESDFNDRTLSLRAGPRILFEKFDLRPATDLAVPVAGRRQVQPGDRCGTFERLADRAGLAVKYVGRGRAGFLRDLPR